ncbi:MAG: polysaccharide biosynthesis/export family protein [Elusimicrobiota bacterium]
MRSPIAAVLALSLAGCSTFPKPMNPDIKDAPIAATPQSAAEEAALADILQQIRGQKSDYRISAADLLQITVFREQDMDRTVRVSQTGEISFPLVGNVKVGGLSQADAETLLAEKLKEFIVSPQVSVFVKEYGNKKVFVLGEVTKPGSYELPPESRLTVLEAISLAGGFTAVAAKDRTRVIRAMSDGKSQSFTIEVSAITSNGQKDKDISLEPNDVVFIPQSFF